LTSGCPCSQFGKYIQAEQIPGWSQFYLDYKFLKKIVSSLTVNRPGSEAAALALRIRPADILNPAGVAPSPAQEEYASAVELAMMPRADAPPILSAVGGDEDKSPDFQAHKAAFFFKLERELEKARLPD
jgi:CDK inhibitor PHO81